MDMSAAPKITQLNAPLIPHLKAVSLFKDIANDAEAMRSLAHVMQERHYKAGEDIIKEGTLGTELFILISGQASVYKAPPQGEEYKVAIFEGTKNISFGESGLIESDLRSATIRADVDSTCLALDRKDFELFSQTRPDWALPVYRRIAHAVMARLKKTNNDMLLLYNALVSEIRGQ
jgi:CRP/FNR family cyclic AMP-dependent transcriptional regulator